VGETAGKVLGEPGAADDGRRAAMCASRRWASRPPGGCGQPGTQRAAADSRFWTAPSGL